MKATILRTTNWWRLACWLVLVTLLIVGTLHLWRGDLFYETDIARDLLLLEDMVAQKKISLIGGRSSIAGVFHGPLYYWLVLPLFVISGGNPVAVSYFWIFTYWLFLGCFYLIGKKIVSRDFALVATTLMASLTAFTPAGLTHTTLANFLILPYLYLLYQYLRTNKLKWLLLTVFTCGVLIQFQMAFGVPVLLLTGTYTIFHILKRKNFAHLLVGLVILIPLSTFLVFDLRHDFIQIKSAWAYLTDGNADSHGGYLNARLQSIVECFRVWKLDPSLLWKASSYLVIGCLVWLGFKNTHTHTSGKKSHRLFVGLGLLIIFGFWLITIPFRGNIWPQYYLTLAPAIVFFFTYFLFTYAPEKTGLATLAFIIGCNSLLAVKSGVEYWHTSDVADEVHWKFYRQMTSDLFADAKGQEFGYYVFSPDQYGYQGKYALHYFTQATNQPAVSYQKRSLTYLIIAPNAANNPWANEDYWQSHQVRIDRAPDSTWTYTTSDALGYTVRRFDLTAEEATIAAEPTLLDDIHFR